MKITILITLATIAQLLAKALFFEAVHQAIPEQIATAAEINGVMMRPPKS
ncbi:MAG: hypothetical protein WBE76_07770 [Terracidiphilus sp.]